MPTLTDEDVFGTTRQPSPSAGLSDSDVFGAAAPSTPTTGGLSDADVFGAPPVAPTPSFAAQVHGLANMVPTALRAAQATSPLSARGQQAKSSLDAVKLAFPETAGLPDDQIAKQFAGQLPELNVIADPLTAARDHALSTGDLDVARLLDGQIQARMAPAGRVSITDPLTGHSKAAPSVQEPMQAKALQRDTLTTPSPTKAAPDQLKALVDMRSTLAKMRGVSETDVSEDEARQALNTIADPKSVGNRLVAGAAAEPEKPTPANRSPFSAVGQVSPQLSPQEAEQRSRQVAGQQAQLSPEDRAEIAKRDKEWEAESDALSRQIALRSDPDALALARKRAEEAPERLMEQAREDAAKYGKVGPETLRKVLQATAEFQDVLATNPEKGFMDTLAEKWGSAQAIKRQMPVIGQLQAAADYADIARRIAEIHDGFVTDPVTGQKRPAQAGDVSGLYHWMTEAAAREASPRDFWGKVASTVSDLPAFAVEFGMAGGGRVAKEGAALGVKGHLAELIGGTVKRFGSLPIAPRLAASAMKETVGELKEGEDFSIVGALSRAFGDNAIEILSEQTGAHIFGPAMSRIPVPKRLSAMKQAIAARWMGKTGKTVEDFARALKEVGYDGVLNEMLEERVGEVLRGVTGIAPYKAPTLEQLAVEAVSFAIPGAGARVGGAAIDQFRDQSDFLGMAKDIKLVSRKPPTPTQEPSHEEAVQTEAQGQVAPQPPTPAAETGASSGTAPTPNATPQVLQTLQDLGYSAEEVAKMSQAEQAARSRVGVRRRPPVAAEVPQPGAPQFSEVTGEAPQYAETPGTVAADFRSTADAVAPRPSNEIRPVARGQRVSPPAAGAGGGVAQSGGAGAVDAAVPPVVGDQGQPAVDQPGDVDVATDRLAVAFPDATHEQNLLAVQAVEQAEYGKFSTPAEAVQKKYLQLATKNKVPNYGPYAGLAESRQLLDVIKPKESPRGVLDQGQAQGRVPAQAPQDQAEAAAEASRMIADGETPDANTPADVRDEYQRQKAAPAPAKAEAPRTLDPEAVYPKGTAVELDGELGTLEEDASPAFETARVRIDNRVRTVNRADLRLPGKPFERKAEAQATLPQAPKAIAVTPLENLDKLTPEQASSAREAATTEYESMAAAAEDLRARFPGLHVEAKPYSVVLSKSKPKPGRKMSSDRIGIWYVPETPDAPSLPTADVLSEKVEPENRAVFVDLFNQAGKSRTFSGTVDTSATKEKAGQMEGGLSPTETAIKSRNNFTAAFRKLWSAKGRKLAGAKLLALFDGVNLAINKGLTKAGVLLRTADSTKFPYLPVADLAQAREEFAEELAYRLENGHDPIATAAWVQWRINLRDHWYADAVGRTSDMVAAWVLDGAGMPVPRAVDAKEFYQHAKSWPEFLSFYRSLFDEDVNRKAMSMGPKRDSRLGDTVEINEFGVPEMPLTLAATDPLLKPAVDGNTILDPKITIREGHRLTNSPDHPDKNQRGIGIAPGTYDRAFVHDKIIDFFKRRAIRLATPTVWFTGGGGGAGKTTVVNKLKSEGVLPQDILEVNADDIRVMLPQYEDIVAAGDGRAAHQTHAESSYLGDRLQEELANEGYSFINDRTMGSRSALADLKKLREKGFALHMIGISINFYEAMVRVARRGMETGRWVSVPTALKAHKGFHVHLAEFVEQFDSVMLFENSRDNRPHLTAEKKVGESSLNVLDSEIYSVIIKRAEVDTHAKHRQELVRSEKPLPERFFQAPRDAGLETRPLQGEHSRRVPEDQGQGDRGREGEVRPPEGESGSLPGLNDIAAAALAELGITPGPAKPKAPVESKEDKRRRHNRELAQEQGEKNAARHKGNAKRRLKEIERELKDLKAAFDMAYDMAMNDPEGAARREESAQIKQDALWVERGILSAEPKDINVEARRIGQENAKKNAGRIAARLKEIDEINRQRGLAISVMADTPGAKIVKSEADEIERIALGHERAILEKVATGTKPFKKAPGGKVAKPKSVVKGKLSAKTGGHDYRVTLDDGKIVDVHAKSRDEAAQKATREVEARAKPTKGAAARAELKDAAKDFLKTLRDSLGGKALDVTSVAGTVLDPAVQKAAGLMIAKFIKAGVYTFAEVIGGVYDVFRKELGTKEARSLMAAGQDALETAWEQIRPHVPQLDQVGSVADMIEAIDAQDAETEDQDNEPDRRDDADAGGRGTSGADVGDVGTQAGTGGEATGRGDDGGAAADQPGQSGGPGALVGAAERGQAGGSDVGGTEPAGTRGTAEDAGEVSGEPATPDRPDRGRGRSDAGDDVVNPNENNHVIAPGDTLAPNTDLQKHKANIRAIKLVRELVKENRDATADEKKALAQYTGWGWIGNRFNESHAEYEKWGKPVRELMSDEEWDAALRSTTNAHFTSPEVIGGMWDILRHMGFTGGFGSVVMEPAAGVGHFFGLMPADMSAGAKLVGVELDKITGAILSKLYPGADIRVEGYEKTRIPDNSVDLAISNVPFGDFPVVGATDYRDLDIPIHDYFFLRTLDKVKPGGIIAFITSHFSMDKLTRKFREQMNERADLIGAVRLPQQAFRKNAGTDVVTDIIFLRKRDGATPEGFEPQPWVGIEQSGTDKVDQPDGTKAEKPILVNEYFAAHPENIIGTPSLQGEMRGGVARGDGEYTVKFSGNVGEALKGLVSSFPTDIAATTDTSGLDAFMAEQGRLAPEHAKQFSYQIDGGTIGQKIGETMERPIWLTENGRGQDPTKRITEAEHKKRLEVAKRWIDLRLAVRRVFNLPSSASADDLKEAQKQLTDTYDAYVKDYGTVNHPTGEHLAAAWFMQDDPDYPLVQAIETEIENGKTKTGRVQKMYVKNERVFTERINPPKEMPEKASDVADAVSINLGYRNAIEPHIVAQLLGTTQEEAKRQVVESGHGFVNPKTGLIEPRARYLSGNVRAKLDEAKTAAEMDEAYKANVTALESVQPARVPINKMSFQLSSRWIPDSVYSAFASEIFGTPTTVTYLREVNAYTVAPEDRYAAAIQVTHGVTGYFSGADILHHAIEGTEPIAYDEVQEYGKTRQVPNKTATRQAKAKVQELKRLFVDKWVPSTQADINGQNVRDILENTYNETLNNSVPPDHDGSYLVLPGMTDFVRRMPHRLSVVARIITEGSGVMAHGVGSGKTLSLVVTAMEMRRLGLAKKPMIVVDNQTIGQFTASFKLAYPNANLLIADEKTFNNNNRKRFMSRIALGDYDAVIVTQPQFDRLKSSPAALTSYFNQRIQALVSAMQKSAAENGKDDPTTKQLQKAVQRLEAKLTKMLDDASANTDNTVFFDELGVDALLVDEAHRYKKIPLVTKKTRLKGISTEFSNRAVNMEIKADQVRRRNKNGRGVVLATGTPVTNTLGESYVFHKIATPHILKEYGIENFDEFANTFGQTEEKIELTWQNRPKRVERFSKFTNGPELVSMIRGGWDVKMGNEALGLVVPPLEGGNVQLVVADPTPANDAITAWTTSIGESFEAMEPKDRKEFSWVPITTMQASLAASLDPRLIDPSLPDDPGSKVNLAIQKVLDIYKANTHRKGTQLVFADRQRPMNTDMIRSFEDAEFFSKPRGHVESDDAPERASEGSGYYVSINGAYEELPDAAEPQPMEGPEGYEGMKFFIHRAKNGRAWIAVDQRSGVGFAQGKSRKGVVTEAMRYLRYRKTPAEFTAISEEYVAKNGEAPHAILADKDAELVKEDGVSEEESEAEAIGAADEDAYKSGEGFHLYREIKRKLVEAGIPENEIAIIHEANTRKKRDALFDKMNNGEVRVLVGSTEKMGVGVNVQARIVGLHHLDPPRMMTPAMWEQRNGRGIRQGNLFMQKVLADGTANPEFDPDFKLNVIAYGTQNSLDATIYQMMETKGKFILQLLTGRGVGRDFSDPGDEVTMSFAQMKALTSGNPLLIKQVDLESVISNLNEEQYAFNEQQKQARYERSQAMDSIREREKQLAAADRENEKIKAAFPVVEAKSTKQSHYIDPAGPFKYEYGNTVLTDPAEIRRHLGDRIEKARAEALAEAEAYKVEAETPGIRGGTKSRPNKDFIKTISFRFGGFLIEARVGARAQHEKQVIEQEMVDGKKATGYRQAWHARTYENIPFDVFMEPGKPSQKVADRGDDLLKSIIGHFEGRKNEGWYNRMMIEEAEKKLPLLDAEIAKAFPRQKELNDAIDELREVMAKLEGAGIQPIETGIIVQRPNEPRAGTGGRKGRPPFLGADIFPAVRKASNVRETDSTRSPAESDEAGRETSTLEESGTAAPGDRGSGVAEREGNQRGPGGAQHRGNLRAVSSATVNDYFAGIDPGSRVKELDKHHWQVTYSNGASHTVKIVSNKDMPVIDDRAFAASLIAEFKGEEGVPATVADFMALSSDQKASLRRKYTAAGAYRQGEIILRKGFATISVLDEEVFHFATAEMLTGRELAEVRRAYANRGEDKYVAMENAYRAAAGLAEPTGTAETMLAAIRSGAVFTAELPPSDVARIKVREFAGIRKREGDAPVFYSKLREVVEQKMGGAMDAGQLRSMLANNGVKPEEMEWANIESLAGKVTKQQVLDHLEENAVTVTEKMLGDEVVEIDTTHVGGGDFYVHLVDKPYREGVYFRKQGDNDYSTAGISQSFSEDGAIEYAEGVFRRTGGNAKFGQYQLPGGTDYRELLLTLPAESNDFKRAKADLEAALQAEREATASGIDVTRRGDITGRTDRAQAIVDRMRQDESRTFASSHYDTPNILAHVRFNTRTDADGKKVLFIEEVQSDWHQKGRDQGYLDQAKKEKLEARLAEVRRQREGFAKSVRALVSDAGRRVDQAKGDAEWGERNVLAQLQRVYTEVRSNGKTLEAASEGMSDHVKELVAPLAEQFDPLTRELYLIKSELVTMGGVPDAPFKKSWHELAMKRMLRYAIDNGYDRVAWTTGEQQAERYDLSKQVDYVNYSVNADGSYNIKAGKSDSNGNPMGGSQTVQKDNIPADELPGVVGKELAQKIVNGEGARWSDKVKVFTGVDLKVGGEGMKGFYDKMLVTDTNKIIKKFGGRVGKLFIPSGVQETGTGSRYANYVDVHGFDITDAMRAEVPGGLPQFAVRRESDSKPEIYAALRRNPENLHLVDAAIVIAADAAGQGLHGEAVEKFAADQVTANMPHLAPSADRIGKLARKFVSYSTGKARNKPGSSEFQSRFERIISEYQDKYDSASRVEIRRAIRAAIEAGTESGTVGQVVMDMRDALEYAFKMQDKGGRAFAKAAREINARFVKASRAVPVAERGKLLGADVQSEADLIRKLEQIKRVLDNWTHRMAFKKVRKLLTKLKPDKMRPEFQAQLKAAIGDVNVAKMSTGTQARLESLAEYLERTKDGAVPDEVKAELIRLKQTALNDMSTDELNALYETVAAILHLNKLKNKLIGERKAKALAEAVASIVGDIEKRHEQIRVNALGRREKSTLGRAISYTASPEAVLASAAGPDSDLVDMGYNAIIRGEGDTLRAVNDNRAEFDRWLKDQGMSHAKLAEWATTLRNVPHMPYQLTGAELVTLAASVRNHKARAKFLNNGFLPKRFAGDPAMNVKLEPEQLDDVLASLTAFEKGMADLMVAQFNGQIKKDLNRVSLQSYGYHLFTEPNYFPLRVDRKQTQTGMESQDSQALVSEFSEKTWLEALGFTHRRESHTHPMIVDSALSLYSEHVRAAGAYIGLKVPIRNMLMILGTPAVKTAAETRLGSDFIPRVTNYLHEIARLERQDKDPSSRMLRWALRNFAVWKLGLRPTTILYNLFGAPTMLATQMTAKESGRMLTGMGKARSYGAQWFNDNIAKFSPYLADRYGHDMLRLHSYADPEIVTMFNSSPKMRERIMEFQNTVLRPMAVAERAGTVAAYLSMMETAKQENPGKSEEELRPRVIERLELAVRRTQNATSAADMSEFGHAARHNPYMGMLAMFTSQAAKMRDTLHMAYLNAKEGKSGARARLAVTGTLVAINAAVIPLLVKEAVAAVLRAITGDDEEEKKRRRNANRAVQSLEGLADVAHPWIGSVVRSVAEVSKAVGKQPNDSPPQSVVDGAIRGVANLVVAAASATDPNAKFDSKQSKGWKIGRAAVDMLNTAGGVFGMPTDFAATVVKGFGDKAQRGPEWEASQERLKLQHEVNEAKDAEKPVPQATLDRLGLLRRIHSDTQAVRKAEFYGAISSDEADSLIKRRIGATGGETGSTVTAVVPKRTFEWNDKTYELSPAEWGKHITKMRPIIDRLGRNKMDQQWQFDKIRTFINKVSSDTLKHQYVSRLEAAIRAGEIKPSIMVEE